MTSDTDYISRSPIGVAVSGMLFLAALGAILAALAFEHYGGYKPCPLCLTERYAYYFSIPAALLAYILLNAGAYGWGRMLLLAIMVAFMVNAGLGYYHAGAEWGWWPGPASCSGDADLSKDAGSLLDSVRKTVVIRCDEAPWRLFGFSFAGYNFLISAGLALVALIGAIRAK